MKALRQQVVDLFAGGRFAELDALSQSFISRRERFTPMLWKLEVLHDALDVDAYLRLGPERLLQLAEQWAKHSPRSAAAQTAFGAALVSRAWAGRGGGYDVTARGGAEYERYIRRAAAELKQREKVASGDPGYYAVLARVAEGADWPQLVASAGRRHPTRASTPRSRITCSRSGARPMKSTEG